MSKLAFDSMKPDFWPAFPPDAKVKFLEVPDFQLIDLEMLKNYKLTCPLCNDLPKSDIQMTMLRKHLENGKTVIFVDIESSPLNFNHIS